LTGPPRTLRIVIEYDGTDLVGWQRQDNGPSVQQHLEERIAEMVGHPVRVTGASRTDAGVHARGQVAAFTTTARIPTHGVRRGLNSLLPPSIAIVACDEVAADFHPRFGAVGKHYRYAILARPDRSPLLRTRAWHRPQALDLEAMRAAAAPLLGEHDFAAFRAAGCAARTTRRRIDGIDITREDELVLIDVRGNAFLRNMVRIIAGSLVDVAMGRMQPSEIAEILASLDRNRAGQTAPAHGLTLMSVLYPV
jgi:tRNA pseudouridine38-40 synthase